MKYFQFLLKKVSGVAYTKCIYRIKRRLHTHMYSVWHTCVTGAALQKLFPTAKCVLMHTFIRTNFVKTVRSLVTPVLAYTMHSGSV